MNKKEITIDNYVKRKLTESHSTVDELRIGVWAPISKLTKASTTYKNFVANKNVRILQTPWGKVEIRNRILTQIHKDIFDAIISNKSNIRTLSNGYVAVYFSLYNVLKILGKSTSNQKWLKDKIDEISDVRIKLINNDKDTISFNILAKVAWSESQSMYGIIIDNDYLNFFLKSLTIKYSNRLYSIARIHDSLIKAIIRFFLTHNVEKYPFSIKLNKLLISVGYPLESTRQMSSAKTSVNKYTNQLKKFEIYYDKKSMIFSYKGVDYISFSNPIIVKDQ